MKILLLGFNVQSGIYPLGLAYLKGYALQYYPDADIQIKEFSFGNRFRYETNKTVELQALSYIILQKPDIVALSCYIWSGETTQNFARAIKKINPSIKVILGGVEVDENSLSEYVDFAIYGEGEIAFKEVLDYYTGNRQLEDIHNMMYLSKGKTIKNEEIVIENLDEIPFPYKYHHEEYDVVRVETTRGCIFNCNFCYYSKPRLRNFSINYVADNLKYLFENVTFSNLTFLDANFNTKKERMFEILDIVAKYASKNLLVHIELRPELIDKEMVEKLERYSFKISAELGFQSSDQEVLKKAKRPTNIDKVKDALVLLDNSSLKYKVDLMYGLPGDTFFKFLNSCKFIIDNASKQGKIVAHHFMPLSNTEFSSVERFIPKNSSMVIKTETQDAVDFYFTKLFVDMVNGEIRK